MFGPANEAEARCGHWVVWDTRAEHTAQWTELSVRTAPCQSCQIAELKQTIATLQHWNK